MRHAKPVRGKQHLPFSRLVGAVYNCAYAVRSKTASTGGESVYLFLESTINPLSRLISLEMLGRVDILQWL